MAKQTKEIAVVQTTAVATPVGGLAPITKEDVQAMKRQRDLLKEFVSSQLVEADFSNSSSKSFGEGDYGVIPGTKKRCLLKQGAEKLQKLFRLGCRFHLADKTIDKDANFAMFIYRAEIYSLINGNVIADCEGAANSQEVKYKQRTVWKKTGKRRPDGSEIKESVMEETPIFDVLNTLMKMAQKRALIGATLLATGASEYFTQDLLDPEDEPAPTEAAPTEAAPQAADEPAKEQAPPVCCGKPMMISKYADRETGGYPWYCIACKNKVPRE